MAGRVTSVLVVGPGSPARGRCRAASGRCRGRDRRAGDDPGRRRRRTLTFPATPCGRCAGSASTSACRCRRDRHPALCDRRGRVSPTSSSHRYGAAAARALACVTRCDLDHHSGRPFLVLTWIGRHRSGSAACPAQPRTLFQGHAQTLELRALSLWPSLSVLAVAQRRAQPLAPVEYRRRPQRNTHPPQPPTPARCPAAAATPSTCRLRRTPRPHPHPELTTPRKATAMSPQPTTATPQPVPYFPLDPPHQHTAGCFWDLDQCRWQCGPPRATAPKTPTSSSIPGSTAEPGSTEPISPDR